MNLQNLQLKELAIKHDYYASGNNYYSNDAVGKYDTWADFYEEFAEADVDMNLVYRWDIHEREKAGRFYMQVVIINQRKGIYLPIHINYVDDKDVPQIIEFMKPHFDKLLSIWQPLSSNYLNDKRNFQNATKQVANL